MTSITGEENPLVSVEVVRCALANCICRPPDRLDEFDLVRLEDFLCRTLQVLQLDVLGLGTGWKLDVKPGQAVLLPFTRDDQ